MDYTIHGILQARILEWVAFPFSRGSSQPRDWTQVSHIACEFFTNWVTREAQAYWSGWPIPSPGDRPDPGIEPGPPALQADSLPAEPPESSPLYTLCAQSLSRIQPFVTLGTVVPEAPLSLRFFQARILEWVAISYSRVFSQLRNWTSVSCISYLDRQFLYH